MKLFFLALLLFLLVGTAAAMDCKNLNGDTLDACNEVLNSNLTADEQNESILALMNQDVFLPNFTAIEQWNTALSFSQPPQGVPLQSSNYIKDSWIRILAAMPSVIENDKLLVPSEGNVLTGYGYQIEMPSSTVSSDCKTEYSLSRNNAVLNVYTNNVPSGHDNLTHFSVASDPDFRSNLKIDVAISVNHYQNVKYCCDTSNGYCVSYCTECREKNSEIFSDSMQLKDTLNATLYEPETRYSLSVINQYYNTTTGRLNFSNFTAVKLVLNNSSYERHSYTYQLTSFYQPYDVLGYLAVPEVSSKSKNMNIQEQDNSVKFIAHDSNSCILELATHFNQSIANCSIGQAPVLPIIETDKLIYLDGEIIHVTLSPSEMPVNVSYGNSTITAYTSASFTAIPSANKVTARLGEVSVDKVIAVQKRSELGLLFGFSIFSGLNLMLYKIIRKFWSF